MIIAGWRDIPALRFAAVLGDERERWRATLSWDYSQSISDIERARVTGQAMGFAALDGDRVAGWSYYITHRDTLLLGHIAAPDPSTTRQLLDAVLHAPEACSTSSAIAFGFFDAPGIHDALQQAGFVVEPYLYLSRDLTRPVDPPRRECGPYDRAANRSVARVLQGAYVMSPPNRPFAIGNTDAEWLEYVTQLTYGNGCGLFDQKSSVLRGAGEAIDGVAIVSTISDETAHLCQLAVNPGARGIGLGVDLLAAACARAKQNGRARMTLTVASSNTAALGLYRRFGFTDVARFTFARK